MILWRERKKTRFEVIFLQAECNGSLTMPPTAHYVSKYAAPSIPMIVDEP
jgi:hypothetical protein